MYLILTLNAICMSTLPKLCSPLSNPTNNSMLTWYWRWDFISKKQDTAIGQKIGDLSNSRTPWANKQAVLCPSLWVWKFYRLESSSNDCAAPRNTPVHKSVPRPFWKHRRLPAFYPPSHKHNKIYATTRLARIIDRGPGSDQSFISVPSMDLNPRHL